MPEDRTCAVAGADKRGGHAEPAGHPAEQLGVADGALRRRDALFADAYPELRRLARSRLRDAGHQALLETTTLVHEAYLRFPASDAFCLDDRRAFFAYASKIMRSVIVDSVRERRTRRRGGDGPPDTPFDPETTGEPESGEGQLLRVHEALLALAKSEPRLAQVVALRYFGGYSDLEIGEALALSDRTVRRDWEKARALLMELLLP